MYPGVRGVLAVEEVEAVVGVDETSNGDHENTYNTRTMKSNLTRTQDAELGFIPRDTTIRCLGVTLYYRVQGLIFLFPS